MLAIRSANMHWTNRLLWKFGHFKLKPFTQDEIKSLEEARFVLNKQHLMFPQSLFERKNSIPINRPLDEMSWPTSHNCKAIHRTVPFKMLNLHYNHWEVGQLLKATINPPLEVPPLGSR